MKKYVKPQMRVYIIESRLLEGSSVELKVAPDEAGDGEAL